MFDTVFFLQTELDMGYHCPIDSGQVTARVSTRMSKFIANWGVARPFENLSDMARLSHNLTETVSIIMYWCIWPCIMKKYTYVKCNAHIKYHLYPVFQVKRFERMTLYLGLKLIDQKNTIKTEIDGYH